MDVDSLRVADAVDQISEAPAQLKDARTIASVVLSGPRDGALLAVCWTTFETDFAGTPWDEVEGFGVTRSR